MSTRTYYRRKAQGLCPDCQAPASPSHVYCDACILAMRRRRFADLPPPLQEAAVNRVRLLPLLAPKAPAWTGPTLACCGKEHAIMRLPFTTPCCARTFFAHIVQAETQERAQNA